MSTTGPYSTQHVGSGASSAQNETPTAPTSHFVLKPTKTKSIIVQVGHTKFAPKYGGNSSGPGDVIRIEIPSVGWLDPENSGLAFDFMVYSDANATTAVGPWNPGTVNASWGWIRPKNGIQSIFNRVKLLAGTSNPIEDLHEYDILDKILLYATAPTDYVYQAGFTLEGLHDGRDYWKQCLMNLWTNSTPSAANPAYVAGHRYFIRPHLGLFRTGKYLPVGYMGLITLEFYLNQPNYCLIRSVKGQCALCPDQQATATGATVTVQNFYNSNLRANAVGNAAFHLTPGNQANYDFPNATYRLRNVYWHSIFVNPLEEYNNAVKAKMEGGTPIKIPTDVYRYHSKQIAQSWSGEQTVTVQERVASLKGIYTVFINEYERANPFRELTFSHNMIDQYRWRLGDVYYPNQPVECGFGGVEPFIELQKAFGQTGDVFGTNLINWENYRPETSMLYNADHLFRRRTMSSGTVHSNRFILAHNFETSLGQYSGVDLMRMNTDIELRFKLDQQTAMILGARKDGPNAMTFMLPERGTYTGITAANRTRRVILPPPVNPKVASSTGPVSFHPEGQTYAFLDDANTVAQQGLLKASGVLLLASLPSETVGYGDYLPVFISDTEANGTANCIAFTSQNDMRYVDCASFSPSPSYYEMVFYTHYDQIVIIETFGTISVTTDIFNVI